MTTGVRPLLQGVGQIAVNVSDLARATAFYRNVLKLPLLFEVQELAFFMCGDVRLMLSRAEQPEFDHAASVIYYRTSDIQAAQRELAAQGVVFEREAHLIARMPDHELWMAFFRDSEGNMLALMSEVRERGSGTRAV